MKFKKKIMICRMDDEVPMRLFHTNDKFKKSRDCIGLDKGICLYDKKKCKIVTYERVVTRELIRENEDRTCGGCVYFTGKECNGKQKGSEKDSDNRACDGFDERRRSN